jgi:hypothetical protein
MKSDVEAILDAVHEEDSFVQFVEALAADWAEECQKESATPRSPYGPGANGWENGTIGTYLDATASWGRASIDGLPALAEYEKPDNPWKRAAQILYMGKIYE